MTSWSFLRPSRTLAPLATAAFALALTAAPALAEAPVTVHAALNATVPATQPAAPAQEN